MDGAGRGTNRWPASDAMLTDRTSGERWNYRQHGQIVDAGRDQHEAMPDRIMIGQPSPEMKDNAARIQDPAGGQQRKRRPVERHQERVQCDEADPTEAEVKRDGNGFDATGLPKLQGDADGGDRPDPDRQAGGPSTLEAEYRKGRVGAGDHGEDRGMIEAPQPVAMPARPQEVVSG